MVIKAHGVGHNLKTPVKATVVLAIDVLGVAIADAKQLVCAVVILTSSVNLKLDTEIALSITVEDGFVLV